MFKYKAISLIQNLNSFKNIEFKCIGSLLWMKRDRLNLHIIIERSLFANKDLFCGLHQNQWS